MRRPQPKSIRPNNSNTSSNSGLGLRQPKQRRPAEEHKEPNEVIQEEEYQDRNRYQVKLSQKELEEEMPTRMLLPLNPQATKNMTFFDYNQRKYKNLQLIEQTVIHFALQGDLIHITSNQFKTQENIQESRKTDFLNKKKEAQAEEPGSGKNEQAIRQSMRNKFNYNSREVQTIYSQYRQRGASTCPPSTDVVKGQVTQWQIFDAYIDQFKKEGNDDEKKDQKSRKKDGHKQGPLYSSSFRKCMKIMQRMVLQNVGKQKYQCYRYLWEDGTEFDEKDNNTNIISIWKFSHGFRQKEGKKKRHVTSLCWNPRYPDLFAVSIGCYDFQKNKTGQILVWSLKNVSHPQYIYNNDHSVMCLDFHPKSPALLAVGLYDGTVLVYDIRNKHKKPIYQSTVRTQKHTDPVWQVRWSPETNKYNLFSISSDGRVMNWSLMKNKLQPQEVIRLRLVGKNEEESTLIGLACGLCFDFSKFDQFIFLAGTQQGKIHKCSRAYSGQYQQTYNGHILAVYKVRWNPFHNRTFISASADWTVRIWDSMYSSQVMCFDLTQIVVDVIWAPYSSTGNLIQLVFVCATLDRIFVYDIYEDKHSKRADHKPTKFAKLTNIAFNYKNPILLAGSSSQIVVLVKLSPQLTKNGQPPLGEKKQQRKDAKQKQKQRERQMQKKKQPQKLVGAALQQNQRLKMQHILGIVSKWQRQ